MIDEIHEQFYTAISTANIDAVRTLLNAHPELLKKPYRDHQPWLIVAATTQC